MGLDELGPHPTERTGQTAVMHQTQAKGERGWFGQLSQPSTAQQPGISLKTTYALCCRLEDQPQWILGLQQWHPLLSQL